jgi:cell wall-associated NlpC family hydrolase
MSTQTKLRQRGLLLVGLLLAVLPMLACVSQSAAVVDQSGSRWACPSPQPLAHGPNGPAKRSYQCNCQPDPNAPGGQICQECRDDYAIWEREYGPNGSLLNGQPAASGPIFPSPTPYAIEGSSFSFGQRVEIAPLHLTVNARSGPLRGDSQLYIVKLIWHNPTDQVRPIDYERQVKLRSVIGNTGDQQTGDGWSSNSGAREAAAFDRLPTSILTGTTTVEVPILAPPGQPRTVEVRFDTPATAGAVRPLVVQWSDINFTVGPPCSDPGALTDWQGDGWGDDVPINLQAPPGSARVVAIAYAQVGKPYILGSTGPNAFDCSGLMFWSYAQVGISGFPRVAADQYKHLPKVSISQLQPGDFLFFDTLGPLTHVGMYVGDLNNDGKADMVHASDPKTGVILTSDVFNNRYYKPRFAGAATVRGWRGN